MSEELSDEITSINSIYGDSTLTPVSPPIYALTLPSQPSISIRIDFPPTYPDTPPSILGTQHVGPKAAKGSGTDLVDLVRSVLAAVYMPGVPCIFDIIEDADQRLQQLGLDRGAGDEEQQAAQANGQDPSSGDVVGGEGGADAQQSLGFAADGPPPPWVLSEVVSEKKSVFVARAASVTSVEQAKRFLGHLLATDKKVAKAAHNITAWRIRGENGVQYQDCDDDGETAAGGRLLHLLELMDVWDTMVVATRWYGGVHLGPDRFRIINQTARDAVVTGGFAPSAGKDESKDSGKKKGKK